MKSKIINFPFKKRKSMETKNNVPCMVSDRWIEFPENSIGHFDGGEFIEISIKTHSYKNDKESKICNMIVTREDLLKAIAEVGKAKE